MSETPVERPTNPYATFMLAAGVIGLVVGGVIAFIAKQNMDSAAMTNEFYQAMGGYGDLGDGGATGWFIFGLVLVGIGVVLLIVTLAQRAARN